MPDCIVVDWHDAGRRRHEVPDQAARAAGRRRPTIMYLTSENDAVHVARAMRSGADVHMMKPFDREQFLKPFAEAGLV